MAVDAVVLNDRPVHAGVVHLRDYVLWRGLHLPHGRRHPLDVVLLPVVGELEPAEAPDAEVDVGQERNAVGFAPQQGLGDRAVVVGSADALLVEADMVLVLAKALGRVAPVLRQRREAVSVGIEHSRHAAPPSAAVPQPRPSSHCAISLAW